MSGYGKAVRARVIGLDRAWWCVGGHGEGGEMRINGCGERDVLGKVARRRFRDEICDA